MLRKDEGIKPGEKIELGLQSNGCDIPDVDEPGETVEDFVGLLAGKTEKVATIDEINAAASQGWAGE